MPSRTRRRDREVIALRCGPGGRRKEVSDVSTGNDSTVTRRRQPGPPRDDDDRRGIESGNTSPASRELKEGEREQGRAATAREGRSGARIDSVSASNCAIRYAKTSIRCFGLRAAEEYSRSTEHAESSTHCLPARASFGCPFRRLGSGRPWACGAVAQCTRRRARLVAGLMAAVNTTLPSLTPKSPSIG